jgi:hypothetical protein
MGHDNRVGVIGDRSGESARIHDAEATAGDLMRGKSVAPAALTRAADAFLAQLHGGPPTAENRAAEGLSHLFEKTPDAVMRAGWLGELTAAGPRAIQAFDRISALEARAGLSDFLAPEEVSALRAALHRPSTERLELIAGWLQREASRESEPRSPVPLAPVHHHEAALPPRRASADDIRSENPPTGGGDGPGEGPEVALDDPIAPEEVRLNEVLRLGPAAVPTLGKLMSNAPLQREFAAEALIHLGRSHDRQAAGHVEDLAKKMTFDHDLRPYAEMILSDLHGGPHKAPAGPAPAHRGATADSWLSRVLDRCDSPSILKAAAGREAMAIRMSLRKLAVLRTQSGAFRTARPLEGDPRGINTLPEPSAHAPGRPL